MTQIHINSVNLMKSIRKLPIEIIRHIIPYTYNFQPRILLEDIKNYNTSKTVLLELYYNFWIVRMGSNQPEDQNWLSNDLMAYSNNYYATMHGYVEAFYRIFQRNIILKTKRDVDKYAHKLENREVNVEINVILGLLTPYERTDIITKFIKNNVNNNNPYDY
jgi:hypothetical protein